MAPDVEVGSYWNSMLFLHLCERILVVMHTVIIIFYIAYNHRVGRLYHRVGRLYHRVGRLYHRVGRLYK